MRDGILYRSVFCDAEGCVGPETGGYPDANERWNTRAIPPTEPVAWRYEAKCGKNEWATEFCTVKPVFETLQLTPLYERPEALQLPETLTPNAYEATPTPEGGEQTSIAESNHKPEQSVPVPSPATKEN